MKLIRLLMLTCFSLLVLVAYPQEQEKKKTNPKTQVQKKTGAKDQTQNKTVTKTQAQNKTVPAKQIKQVPNSKTLLKKRQNQLKNSAQKQRMKKFVRKANVKRKRGLKRK